jgi:glycosyltransferase involved in cell wall biosynthesis
MRDTEYSPINTDIPPSDYPELLKQARKLIKLKEEENNITQLYNNWEEKEINNLPLVSISCMTYNHAPYIRQCLEGFLMQKIDFPIEVLIHDDASTDGTVDIIREYEQKYPEIIKPIYQTENQYSKGIDVFTVYNISRARGKYIAICEGDDYWIDPYKLQKQVDFLEKNSEYGMCYTRAKKYSQKNSKYLRVEAGGSDCSFHDLMKRNVIPTLTVCLKKNLLIQYNNDIKPGNKHWLQGDYPTWLWFAYNSKIYFMNDVTGVYRILEESVSHSSDIKKQSKFIHSEIRIQRYFFVLYNYQKIDFNTREASSMAYLMALFGEYKQYRKYISKIRISTFKIFLKKIIGKTYFLFHLYNIFLGYREKYW